MSRVKIRREMAKNTAEARANMLKGIKRIGGLRKVSYIVDISETSLRAWIKTGDLNKAQTIHAFRFARAAGESIESFIVVDDECIYDLDPPCPLFPARHRRERARSPLGVSFRLKMRS